MKKVLQIALLSIVVVALCQAGWHLGKWHEYDVLTNGAPAKGQQPQSPLWVAY